MASSPEAHTLLSVVALAEVGMPAAIDAWRAGAWPAPAWITWPMMTSSTAVAGRPARSIAALIATAPSWVAGWALRPPSILAIGVRAAPRIYVWSWPLYVIGCMS